MRRSSRAYAWLVLLCALFAATREARAHWCSNIFAAPARLVVKAEVDTLHVSGGSAQLRVYLQNNFPYRLFGVQMRGLASSYTVTVSPASQDIYPGQNASYLFTVTGPNNDIPVSTLTLQVDFRLGDWRGPSDCLVNQQPTQSLLLATAQGGGNCGSNQAPALSAATLADKYPSAALPSGPPYFGRNGLRQLIHKFGYRFCYSSDGGWSCIDQDCPSPCAEGTAWANWDNYSTFAHECVRAGVELAARKSKLGALLPDARAAATNALRGNGSQQHKCAAALIGGYLWNEAADASPFTSELAASGNNISAICRAAGLRALGGTTVSTCATGQAHERAVCAAAEGLQGNYGPVNSVLKQYAGDGESSNSVDSLYYANMLYLVAAQRREALGYVPFYPDAGGGVADSSSRADTTPSHDVLPRRDSAVTRDTQVRRDSHIVVPDRGVVRDHALARDTAGLDATSSRDGQAPLADSASSSRDGQALLADGQRDAPPAADGTGVGGDAEQKLVGGCGCTLAERASARYELLALLGLSFLALRRRRASRSR